MGLNRLQTVIVQRVVEDVIQGFSVFYGEDGPPSLKKRLPPIT